MTWPIITSKKDLAMPVNYRRQQGHIPILVRVFFSFLNSHLIKRGDIQNPKSGSGVVRWKRRGEVENVVSFGV